ncbi:hypothetical protein KO465_06510 [Candidatus Micrarchaeota archaeon]|nr:hypothetical protein [Candidatus Micrarchaeota archaeon]
MEIKTGIYVGVGIVVLFLISTLILSILGTAGEQRIEEREANIEILYEKSGLLSHNEEYVPFITYKTNITYVTQSSVDLWWFQNKPLKEIYFVTGRGVEANSIETMKSEVEYYSSFFEGLNFRTGYVEGVENIENSVIVIPSGRMPQKIYQNIHEIIRKGNVIIYVGMDIDYVIDDSGSLIETYEKRSLEKSSYAWEVQKGEWNTIAIKDNGMPIGYMLHMPSSPDRVSGLSGKIFDAILYNRWQEPLSQKTYQFTENVGYATFFGEKAKYSGGHLRTIFSVQAENKTLYQIEDYVVEYPLIGRMFYNVNKLKGEPIDINMKLRSSYLQPVHLIMYTDFIHNNHIIDSQKLSEIRIKQVWESSSTVQNKLHPGEYIISLRDQYNNVWALGYLHISGLYAVLNEIKEGEGKFYVSIEGQPLTGVVDVYIDDEYNGNYKVSRGYTYIDLPKDEHKIKFVYEHSDWEFSFNNTTETLLERYLNVMGPALLLFVVIFVLFRRQKPITYRLIVPKITEKKTKTKKINEKQLIGIFDKIYQEFEWEKTPLPLNIREIMYGIRKYMEPGEEVYVTEGNLIEILNGLIEKNIVEGCEDYYMPLEKQNLPIRIAVLKRKVHDILISRGIKFKEYKERTEISELAVFYGDKKIVTLDDLKHDKKIVIVFDSLDQKNKMLKHIMTHTNKINLELSTAITAQKVVFLTLGEFEDYV